MGAVALAGCTELPPEDTCALKDEVFAGHTGDNIRCDLPNGRQDVCIVEALKKHADSGFVALGYRWLESNDDRAKNDLNLLMENFKCRTKYPCGEEGNGPCTQ